MRLVFSLVLLSVVILVGCLQVFAVLPSYAYETIMLLFLGTAGIYFFLVDIKKNRSEYFVQLYIATLFVKMLAYGGYVLYMVWDDKSQAANNAAIFMVTYFIFTAVEIYFLYRKVTS